MAWSLPRTSLSCQAKKTRGNRKFYPNIPSQSQTPVLITTDFGITQVTPFQLVLECVDYLVANRKAERPVGVRVASGRGVWITDNLKLENEGAGPPFLIIKAHLLFSLN